MNKPRQELSRRRAVSRRDFLRASTAALAVGALSGQAEAAAAATVEWRHRQAGMAYRRLGRTGLGSGPSSRGAEKCGHRLHITAWGGWLH